MFGLCPCWPSTERRKYEPIAACDDRTMQNSIRARTPVPHTGADMLGGHVSATCPPRVRHVSATGADMLGGHVADTWQTCLADMLGRHDAGGGDEVDRGKRTANGGKNRPISQRARSPEATSSADTLPDSRSGRELTMVGEFGSASDDSCPRLILSEISPPQTLLERAATAASQLNREAVSRASPRTPAADRGVTAVFLSDLHAALISSSRTSLTPAQLVWGTNSTGPFNFKHFDPKADPCSIAATTKFTALSFVETCQLAGITRSDMTDGEYFKPATCFVSYGWHGTVVAEQIESLLAEGEQEAYWIDIFAVAQNQSEPQEKLNNASDVQSFEQVVKATKQTKLYWAPYDSPNPMCRVWCLYEILLTVRQQNKLDVFFRLADIALVDKEQQQQIRQPNDDSGRRAQLQLAMIRSVDSQATFADDWYRIHFQIEATLNPESTLLLGPNDLVGTSSWLPSNDEIEYKYGLMFHCGYCEETSVGGWLGSAMGHRELDRVCQDAVAAALVRKGVRVAPSPVQLSFELYYANLGFRAPRGEDGICISTQDCCVALRETWEEGQEHSSSSGSSKSSCDDEECDVHLLAGGNVCDPQSELHSWTDEDGDDLIEEGKDGEEAEQERSTLKTLLPELEPGYFVQFTDTDGDVLTYSLPTVDDNACKEPSLLCWTNGELDSEKVTWIEYNPDTRELTESTGCVSCIPCEEVSLDSPVPAGHTHCSMVAQALRDLCARAELPFDLVHSEQQELHSWKDEDGDDLIEEGKDGEEAEQERSTLKTVLPELEPGYFVQFTDTDGDVLTYSLPTVDDNACKEPSLLCWTNGELDSEKVTWIEYDPETRELTNSTSIMTGCVSCIPCEEVSLDSPVPAGHTHCSMVAQALRDLCARAELPFDLVATPVTRKLPTTSSEVTCVWSLTKGEWMHTALPSEDISLNQFTDLECDGGIVATTSKGITRYESMRVVLWSMKTGDILRTVDCCSLATECFELEHASHKGPSPLVRKQHAQVRDMSVEAIASLRVATSPADDHGNEFEVGIVILHADGSLSVWNTKNTQQPRFLSPPGMATHPLIEVTGTCQPTMVVGTGDNSDESLAIWSWCVESDRLQNVGLFETGAHIDRFRNAGNGEVAAVFEDEANSFSVRVTDITQLPCTNRRSRCFDAMVITELGACPRARLLGAADDYGIRIFSTDSLEVMHYVVHAGCIVEFIRLFPAPAEEDVVWMLATTQQGRLSGWKIHSFLRDNPYNAPRRVDIHSIFDFSESENESDGD